LAGNFKFVNPTAERIFGYGCDEICRMNIAQVVAPNFADEIQKQITVAASEDLGAVYEIEIVTKDRRRVVLEASTHLVRRNGCPFELQGIAFSRAETSTGRPQCLDEKFTFGTMSYPLQTLTF